MNASPLFPECITSLSLEGLPWVVYREPGESAVNVLCQISGALVVNPEPTIPGFIFTPFHRKHPNLLIPFSVAENQTLSVDAFGTDRTASQPDSWTEKDFNAAKKAHLERVNIALSALEGGLLHKVVMSRKARVQVPDLDIWKSFSRMLHAYPNAMVYVWWHPESGLWMGATPETLIKTRDRSFSTMSLAATRPYTGSITTDWQEKDYKEQEIVTKTIEKALTDLQIPWKSGPLETVRAGNLLHLQTLISGYLPPSVPLKALMENLHPTPAIAGAPKGKAIAFILKNEGYDRRYYTGLLGIYDPDHHSSVYVNLRCMEIVNHELHLYVGGGINALSDPEQEWEETCHKAATLLQILSSGD